MNLILGRLMDDAQSMETLDRIEELILDAYEQTPLTAEAVVRACGRLAESLCCSEYLSLLQSMGMTEAKAKQELETARLLLSEQYLKNRLRREFEDAREPAFLPYGGKNMVRQEWKPLGVLLHIAAGNVDALPVFSVIEGLLTGNINILKLPGDDGGLSVMILRKLMEIEPLIAKRVFVFDCASENTKAMQRMAKAADAIIVWGGDAAVLAVRRLAQPDTRIIEWGHKISFAYVSGEADDNALEEIADNICDTEQLFCNSCQGIYLDTEDFEETCRFARRFAAILERSAAATQNKTNDYLTAQKTLELYTEQLEASPDKKSVFRREGCSVIAYNDSELTPSYMFRNCWVRPLPKKRLLPELLKYKNHLQTVALVCAPKERTEIEDILAKTGTVRITSGKNMSKSYCGSPHDGEFALSRHMKVMSYEY